jgi:hypothetical protein
MLMMMMMSKGHLLFPPAFFFGGECFVRKFKENKKGGGLHIIPSRTRKLCDNDDDTQLYKTKI